MSLEGKVALITGGGTGTGRSIALAFARIGASLAINYSRSAEDAEKTVADLRALGAKAEAFRADVSSKDQVATMVASVMEKFGRLDILVNNAGYTSFVPLEDLDGITDEIWNRTVDVNLKGNFLCSREAVRAMRKSGGGCIINIAGTTALNGQGSSIIYSATKAGIVSFTRTMATSLAPEIRVNAISPGIISDTRWTKGKEDFNESGRLQTPMKRLATADDIAAAAVYLADAGSIVNGQNIVVDGGRVVCR